MPNFAAGVVEFQENVYPGKRDLFEKLSKGQSPEALFITCSDSRIETGVMTQSDPGELFVCRNAGNIVPPHTTHTGGMTASIEFAMAVLKIPHIVVCGHTDCGAMKGAMNKEGLDAVPHVKEWLSYSDAAVRVMEEIAGDKNYDEKLRVLLEQNVILQLTHLKTHPSVAARLAAGDVVLHGWMYDIGTGDVLAFDEAQHRFIPVAEKYKDAVAARLGHDHSACDGHHGHAHSHDHAKAG